MKQVIIGSALALFGSVVLAAGCSSSTPAGPTDGGGDTGSSVPGTSLTPDPTGWVDRTATGTTGIQGAWYGYGDGAGADGLSSSGDCVKLGGHPANTCSMISSPMNGNFANTGGIMCTTGTAALVLNGSNGMPDYSEMWGAGIALDLNAEGGDAGGTKSPYNATMNHVIGFSFDFVDMTGAPLAPPLTGLRVEFPTPATGSSAAFWGSSPAGSNVAGASPVKKGHNSFTFDKVAGPFYAPATAPAFDPMNINSIQFHVFTNTSSSVPYSFCIANLTALTN